MNKPLATFQDEPPAPLPDHTQLPDSDGTFAKTFQEHPQSILLTDSLGPVLQRLHPDGHYVIGQDSGIYWRLVEPPEKGAESPDWFYVPHVPPLLDGKMRRSFVLWHEQNVPLIALEFASGDGTEEHDATPLRLTAEGETTRPGKFWVYEQIIRIPYYGIYEMISGKLEVYYLLDSAYRKLTPNEQGRYPIPPLGVELGLWWGCYQQQEQLWMRWWDKEGNLLLIGREQAKLESQRAEHERKLAAQERERAEHERELAAQERERAEQEQEHAEHERERAEHEQERAEQAKKQAQLAEQAQQHEALARREAIPRLLKLGLPVEQVAEALELSVEEVRQWTPRS